MTAKNRVMGLSGSVLLLLAITGAQINPAQVGHEKYGREWCLHAPDAEISALLNGYYDCLTPGEQRGLPGWYPTAAMVKKLDEYYFDQGGHSSVIEAARRIARDGRIASPKVGDEVYTARHRYYDGVWWRGGQEDHRVGYVEGYLLCLKGSATRQRAQLVAAAISDWYRLHPARDGRPIANVLLDQLRALPPTSETKPPPSGR